MLGALLMERVSRRKTTEVLAESHSFRRSCFFDLFICLRRNANSCRSAGEADLGESAENQSPITQQDPRPAI